MAIQDHITDKEKAQAKQSAAVQSRSSGISQSRIKVIGVGSGGCNCIKRMMKHPVPNMTFAMVNTDDNVLGTAQNKVDAIRISDSMALAWESGGEHFYGIPEADDSWDRSSEQLRQSIAGSDVVFVTAGMGGGTGTGAMPYVARLAKEQGGVVVIALATPVWQAAAIVSVGIALLMASTMLTRETPTG